MQAVHNLDQAPKTLSGDIQRGYSNPFSDGFRRLFSETQRLERLVSKTTVFDTPFLIVNYRDGVFSVTELFGAGLCI
jgi:hypothetical protein